LVYEFGERECESEVLYEKGEGGEDVAWKVVFGLKKEKCGQGECKNA